jgi:hypothetical protein
MDLSALRARLRLPGPALDIRGPRSGRSDIGYGVRAQRKPTLLTTLFGALW